MILKKKRIIQLSIYKKSSSWYRDGDEYKKLLEPTKIPLLRLPVKCGRKCEFSRICSFWAPPYKLEGIKKVKISYTTISESVDFCNCSENGSKFEYIFTYEILRHYLPVEVLKDLGIYKEPALSKKPLRKQSETPLKNSINPKSHFWGNNMRGGNVKFNKNFVRRK